MKLRTLSTALTLAGLGLAMNVHAAGISDDVIRIGFIADMSGVYADIDGNAGADAIRMAIADMGGEINGKKIELLTADHQNKADIASARAREWFDQQNLDMLIGGTNSATALAMAAVAAEKKKPFMAVGPGSSALTNAQCTPYTVHYAYNTIALANGTGSAVVSEGGKTWYFLTADYAFGHSLEQDTSKVVEANGGKVLGAVRAPISTTDFSSFLLQAQSSGAEVLGLANAGGDFINSVKAAKEFGITNSMKLAGLLVFINDVHALGLENTAGLYLTTAWYWNQDDESRAWAKRFSDQHNRAPSFLQAGDYSVAKTYLESVKATGTDDGDAIMAHLKSIEINDMFMKKGHIRADGLTMHDMYLAQVKTPDQSKAPWDYYNIVKTLPAEAVYGPLSSSTCPLLKK
ncbi:ABC transporter substrate-binding protein [Castellaniella sp. S9]|uniref:ABC transporter substrate-binding protein n=1 Tax=Castellaniella sp. S9 TaxID=2993652 RepID=UPI0022B343DD|nr:ABC transporter substrate-binding protein [Castellaniella sp. S9]